MSLEYDLEEIVIDALLGITVPASLTGLAATHDRSDDEATSWALTVSAKVGDVCYEGGFPFDCEVTVSTRIPILTPDGDGNAQTVSAADEDALWEEIDEILRTIGNAGHGSLTSRLTWMGTKSKSTREDGDKFRHRSRMIPCKAR